MEKNIGLKKGTVVLRPYNRNWKKLFEVEKEFLQKLLGDSVLDIQHIGSTSIPRLSAKPIIDMLAAVRSLSDVSKIRPHLENAGYTYRQNGSDSLQEFFVKGSEEERTHYLHITRFNSSVWRNDLAFRNYLQTHTEEMRQYEKLKNKLAKQYADKRALYTAGKKEFIEKTLKKV